MDEIIIANEEELKRDFIKWLKDRARVSIRAMYGDVWEGGNEVTLWPRVEFPPTAVFSDIELNMPRLSPKPYQTELEKLRAEVKQIIGVNE